MIRVAIYARYSTDLQDKTSNAGQVSNCEAVDDLIEKYRKEVWK